MLLAPHPRRWRTLRPTVLLALLLLASGRARAEPHRLPTASIELGALSAECFRAVGGLELENRILVRLVQEGYAVVATNAAPDLLLRLTCRDSTLLMTEERSGSQRSLRLESLPLPQLHLLAGQTAVELARQSLPLTRIPPAPEPPPPAAPSPAPGPRAWRASAGMGALVRSPRTDPRLIAELSRQVGAVRPLLSLGYLRSPSPGIEVQEIEALAGLRRALPLGSRFSLEALGRAGARLHLFELEDQGALPARGARTSAVLEVGAASIWQLAERFSLGVEVLVHGAAGEVEHLLDGSAIWARSSWGASAGMQIHWSF